MSNPGQPPPDPRGSGGWGVPDPSQGWGAPDPGGGYQQPAPPPGAASGPTPGAAADYGQYGTGTPGPYPPSGQFAPQPGVVPLRPLTLGEIYDGAIRSIRANPVVMFALSAVLVAISVTVQGIATWGMFEDLNRLLADPGALEDMESLDTLASTVQSGLLGYGISAVVTFLITTVLTGLLIHSVSQSVIGRKMSLGQVWAAVRGQILRLLGLSLVIGVLLTGVAALAFGLIALSALTSEPGVIALVGALAVLGMVVAMLAVVVFTVLATPVLVLERSGILTALRRSFQLTRRSFWRILGIYLLTAILVGILAQVMAYPFGAIGGLLGSLTAIQVASLLGSVIALAVTTPFMAAVTALLYIDVRIRTEALDVELARAAEAA